MKKCLFVLMSIVIVVGMLGACSHSDQTGKTEITKDPEKVSGEITVWGFSSGAKAYKAVIPEFKKKYPNVEVNVQQFNNAQLYKKMTAGLAAGGSGLPDVTTIESNHMQVFTSQFPNGFTNLSKLGFDKFADKFSKSKVQIAKNKDGDFLAMPWDIGPVMVFYRKDLFKKADVDPSSIKTWDQYIEAGKKLEKAMGVKMIGLEIGANDGVFRIMLNQQETYYFDQDGNINLNTDKALKAASTLQEFSKKGIAANVNDWNGHIAAMKNGKIATVPTASWWVGTMLEQAPEMSGKWGVFPLPAFEKGGNHAANDGGSNLVIPSSSDNKSAAYAFAKFFTTNKQPQITSLKETGIFPSLKTTYDDSYFEQNVEYYGQPIYKKFAEVVPNIPPRNYTSDYAVAKKVGADALTTLLLEGKSPEQVLKDASQTLAQKTGRKVNK